MKKADFKQLSKEQLRKVKGGNLASAIDCCGPQPGCGRCPDGMCCSKWGWCGITHDYCSVEYCDPNYGECWL